MKKRNFTVTQLKLKRDLPGKLKKSEQRFDRSEMQLDGALNQRREE